MSTTVNRREFLLRSSAIAVGGALLGATATGRTAVAASGLRKGVCIGTLPEGMTVLEKFEMTKRAGFEGVQPNTLNSADEVRQYREAA
jgi:hypothetical protein